MFAMMLGNWEILILLVLMAVMVGGVLAIVFFALWLARRNHPNPPPISAPSGPAHCPRCGSQLPPESPEGLCPRCVLGVGIETQTEAGPAFGPHGTKVPKPPPPEPADIAKLFPQLEILECLGRGGMGAVYKARQSKLDRFVALKILTPERQADAQFRERFEREARTLARLSHPNIVAIYDFGETNGYCYLLMEFVDGVTLRQLIRSRKLMPEEALGIVPKVCEALEFAHGRGVVHRDIKPENILLDRAGQLKIADFGIAKILQPGMQDFSLTGAKDVVGTPHYMAPEQVEHPTKVDHRADIFSLGVVFYEMLTGELPLGKFAPPSRKVQVDVRLDQIVLHALEKDPARRYQHASEVKTDVETVASHPRSPQDSPVIGTREGALRRGWVLAALCAVVLAVGSFALWRMVRPATASLTSTAWVKAPPVVIQTIPSSGAAEVDPAITEFRVTFSKPMRDGCWSWVDLHDGSFPEMTGEPHYLKDQRTCVLPVKLEPGRVYATWINVGNFQNFQDENGLPAVPYLMIFNTRK